MYTLFLDTHGSLITVGLYDGVNLYEKRQESHYSHAVFFVPMIESIMKENNVSFSDIKNIVVVNGPGSFTGLRIGLSVGKTMAYSLDVPIYLVSTLKAFLVSDSVDDDKVAIMPDNKGFYVGYVKNGELEEKYEDDIRGYSNVRCVDENIDTVKVINYALSCKPAQTHLVRANYVKKIEAEK